MEGKTMVNPILAAILSFLIPGLGQIIGGDTKNGIILLVAWFILDVVEYMLMPTNKLVIIMSIILSIYAAYHAYKLTA